MIARRTFLAGTGAASSPRRSPPRRSRRRRSPGSASSLRATPHGSSRTLEASGRAFGSWDTSRARTSSSSRDWDGTTRAATRSSRRSWSGSRWTSSSRAATPATVAAKRATQTIPIVMAHAGDPSRVGSWRAWRDRGERHGIDASAPELAGKRLELLKEAVPGLSRVAVLVGIRPFPPTRSVRRCESAARTLGRAASAVEVRAPEDFEPRFRGMTRSAPEGPHPREPAHLHAPPTDRGPGGSRAGCRPSMVERVRGSRRPDVVRGELADRSGAPPPTWTRS